MIKIIILTKWESEEALNRFRESDLARTIPTAYQVRGMADIQVAELVMKLRDDAERKGS